LRIRIAHDRHSGGSDCEESRQSMEYMKGAGRHASGVATHIPVSRAGMPTIFHDALQPAIPKL
jgi:hypothetical protein